MNVFTWYWLIWFVVGFGVMETVALVRYPDRPGKPHTLSSQVWWLVKGAGLWHRLLRIAVLFLMAWLTVHLLTGGWI